MNDKPSPGSELNPSFTTLRGTPPGAVDIFNVENEPDFATLMSLNDDSVYICANWLSDEVSNKTLKIYTNKVKRSSPFTRMAPFIPASKRLKAANVQNEILVHPAKTLLAHPNPCQTAGNMLKLIDYQLSLTGNAFVHKRREECGVQKVGTQYRFLGDGLPTELWLLKIQNVQLAISDKDKQVVIGVWYNTGGTPIFYPLDDLIWFKLDNPEDPMGFGRGPTRGVYERILLAKYEMAYEQSLYRNQGRPDSLALMPDSTPDQREAFEKQFYQRFSKGAMGGIMAVDPEGEVSEFKALGWSPKDVIGPDRAKWIKLQIINAFKLNNAVLDQESSNRAVATVAKQQAEQYAVYPRLNLIEEKLTHNLLQADFDPSLICEFEKRIIEDDDFKLREDMELMKYGVKTANEVAKERNLPTHPWGDEPFKPIHESLKGNINELPPNQQE